jgi:YHS domain-containing protein
MLRRTFLLTLAALPTLAPPALAEPPARVFAERGLAIRGTDPVAYFTEGRPVRGRAEFTHTWAGATWRFASAANRDRFATDPERYAPAYGGFCAWAVSEGYTAPIDPAAWRIVDGRLFLNYDRSVQRQWERDIPGRIARGDANWPAVQRAAN